MLAEIFDGLKSYFFKASMDDKNALSQDRVQDKVHVVFHNSCCDNYFCREITLF